MWWLPSLLLLQLLLTLGASAQTAITISAVNSLSFGSIARSTSNSIDYESASAARFNVTGDSASRVRLTVSFSDLTAQNGASVNSIDRSLTPSLGNPDCAYSLDGGATWSTFSSGALYQDTQFPADVSGAGTIVVRVGGSVTTGLRQQRGTYNGTITLTAEYR
jgi:hypothetical protein